MLKTVLLFILALLPILILGYYTYSMDKEKEPKKVLIKLFLGGIGSVIITIILSLILQKIFPYFDSDVNSYSPFKLLLYTFFIVSFVEELSKFIVTYKLSYYNKEYDELYDMIVYSVFVALGFAWIENLLYVFNGGIKIAINRLLFAVPTHASVAVFMGYYLSMAKLCDEHKKVKLKRYNMFLSLLIPIVLHGIYDYLVYSNNYTLFLLFFIFIGCMFKLAHEKLKEMASINVVLIKKYCPNCGSSVEKCNYCKDCGCRIIE